MQTTGWFTQIDTKEIEISWLLEQLQWFWKYWHIAKGSRFLAICYKRLQRGRGNGKTNSEEGG